MLSFSCVLCSNFRLNLLLSWLLYSSIISSLLSFFFLLLLSSFPSSLSCYNPFLFLSFLILLIIPSHLLAFLLALQSALSFRVGFSFFSCLINHPSVCLVPPFVTLSSCYFFRLFSFSVAIIVALSLSCFHCFCFFSLSPIFCLVFYYSIPFLFASSLSTFIFTYL